MTVNTAARTQQDHCKAKQYLYLCDDKQITLLTKLTHYTTLRFCLSILQPLYLTITNSNAITEYCPYDEQTIVK